MPIYVSTKYLYTAFGRKGANTKTRIFTPIIICSGVIFILIVRM